MDTPMTISMLISMDVCNCISMDVVYPWKDPWIYGSSNHFSVAESYLKCSKSCSTPVAKVPPERRELAPTLVDSSHGYIHGYHGTSIQGNPR